MHLGKLMISSTTDQNTVHSAIGGKFNDILFVKRRSTKGRSLSSSRYFSCCRDWNLKTTRIPIRDAYDSRQSLDGMVLSQSSSSSSFKLRRGLICGSGDSYFNRFQDDDDDDDVDDEKEVKSNVSVADEDDVIDDKWLQESWNLGNSTPIVSACFVGLFTGITVVLFNYAVHEIRDLCWGLIPDRGASWLREEPFESKWVPVILVPAFGGLLVSLINMVRTSLEDSTSGSIMSNIKSTLKPVLKTVAACVTLGTGNSLGPEGPSVEIGVSVAKGIGAFFGKAAEKNLSLRASGSAAGLSSGFNAAVAGCFFAVESVLWPAPSESSLSLTNTTSMVILSAVIASVISEIGLGSEPAFAVPLYDFRSASELPLYLLLGIFCALVSLGMSKSTSFMFFLFNGLERATKIPKAAFPILGGLAVGLIALAYPEILYWGFQNVDTLLESRPFTNSLSAELLLQLLAAKIVATSLCRASGLVGGYYAPSLFIGAATGMAYGKIVGYVISHSDPMFHLSILEVASPQAYGLVGMAATLAGVCQVPLTAVLLLFELTQDYRIVLPLLGAVGLSSWITSEKTKKKPINNSRKIKDRYIVTPSSTKSSKYSTVDSTSNSVVEPNGNSICDLESSLCLSGDESDSDEDKLASRLLVSQAMRTKYVTTLMRTSLIDVVSLMLEEKQTCAIIVDERNRLIGQLTLSDIQQFIELSRVKLTEPQVLRVSELCSSYGERCSVSCTVTPTMNLFTALNLMNRHGISQLPVILENESQPVGLLDRESVDVAFRAFAIQEGLGWLFVQEKFETREK